MKRSQTLVKDIKTESTVTEAKAEIELITMTEARAEIELEAMELQEPGRTTMGVGPEVIARRPNILEDLL